MTGHNVDLPGCKKAPAWSRRRSRTVAALYADIGVGCVFTACLGCLALEFAVPHITMPGIAIQRFTLPVQVIDVACTVVLAGLFSVRPLNTVLRLRHWRSNLARPSSSLMIVLALLPVCALMYVWGYECTTILTGVGVLFAAPILRDIWGSTRSWLQLRTTLNDAGKPMLPAEMGWIWTEMPLKSIAEDRFGHTALVRRLATMIHDGTCRSFGLTGPHGSGKTTVIRMVETELSKVERNIWFVRASGWGKRVDELPAFVLSEIVEVLHKRGVETLTLSTWPVDYMKEVVGAGTWFSRVLGLCMQSQQNSAAGASGFVGGNRIGPGVIWMGWHGEHRV